MAAVKFMKFYKAVLFDNRVGFTMTYKLLYCYMADRNGRKFCQSQAAAELECAVRTIQRGIKFLKDNEFITVEDQGFHRVNKYTLNPLGNIYTEEQLTASEMPRDYDTFEVDGNPEGARTAEPAVQTNAATIIEFAHEETLPEPQESPTRPAAQPVVAQVASQPKQDVVEPVGDLQVLAKPKTQATPGFSAPISNQPIANPKPASTAGFKVDSQPQTSKPEDLIDDVYVATQTHGMDQSTRQQYCQRLLSKYGQSHGVEKIKKALQLKPFVNNKDYWAKHWMADLDKVINSL